MKLNEYLERRYNAHEVHISAAQPLRSNYIIFQSSKSPVLINQPKQHNFQIFENKTR